jgi:hypothetical protein
MIQLTTLEFWLCLIIFILIWIISLYGNKYYQLKRHNYINKKTFK